MKKEMMTLELCLRGFLPARLALSHLTIALSVAACFALVLIVKSATGLELRLTNEADTRSHIRHI
jgi:hypothetical protein